MSDNCFIPVDDSERIDELISDYKSVTYLRDDQRESIEATAKILWHRKDWREEHGLVGKINLEDQKYQRCALAEAYLLFFLTPDKITRLLRHLDDVQTINGPKRI